LVANILLFFLLIMQFIFVLVNLIGLPGNILSLIIPLIFLIASKITVFQFLIIVVLILIGEVIEFLFGYYAGKNVGTVKGSFTFSVICSIICAIFMAPIFFGLGSIIGAFLGAFVGTFLYELVATKDLKLALTRGVASFKGRFLGTFSKIILGIATVIMSGFYIY